MSCFLCFSHRYCHSSSRFVSPFRFSHCFSLFLFFILWLFVVDCLLPLPFVNSLIILSLSLRLSPFLRALSSSSLSSSPLFHPFIPPFNLPFQIPPEFQNAFRYTQHSAFQRLFVPSLVCLCDDCSTPSLLLHPFDSLTKPAQKRMRSFAGKTVSKQREELVADNEDIRDDESWSGMSRYLAFSDLLHSWAECFVIGRIDVSWVFQETNYNRFLLPTHSLPSKINNGCCCFQSFFFLLLWWFSRISISFFHSASVRVTFSVRSLALYHFCLSNFFITLFSLSYFFLLIFSFFLSRFVQDPRKPSGSVSSFALAAACSSSSSSSYQYGEQNQAHGVVAPSKLWKGRSGQDSQLRIINKAESGAEQPAQQQPEQAASCICDESRIRINSSTTVAETKKEREDQEEVEKNAAAEAKILAASFHDSRYGQLPLPSQFDDEWDIEDREHQERKVEQNYREGDDDDDDGISGTASSSSSHVNRNLSSLPFDPPWEWHPSSSLQLALPHTDTEVVSAAPFDFCPEIIRRSAFASTAIMAKEQRTQPKSPSKHVRLALLLSFFLVFPKLFFPFPCVSTLSLSSLPTLVEPLFPFNYSGSLSVLLHVSFRFIFYSWISPDI